MADVTLDEKSMQIWASLVATLQAEMAPGKRLSGVQKIGNSIHLWSGKSPAIGVQLLHQPEEGVAGEGGMGKHRIELKFQIVAGAASVGTDARKANLDDANTALQAVIADGAGNGLGPVLRGMTDTGPPAGAYRTQVKDVRWTWMIEDGEGVPVWAYAVVDFSVWTMVRI